MCIRQCGEEPNVEYKKWDDREGSSLRPHITFWILNLNEAAEKSTHTAQQHNKSRSESKPHQRFPKRAELMTVKWMQCSSRSKKYEKEIVRLIRKLHSGKKIVADECNFCISDDRHSYIRSEIVVILSPPSSFLHPHSLWISNLSLLFCIDVSK